MIIKTTSYQTSDGSIHPTIEAAQQHELAEFLKGTEAFDPDSDFNNIANKMVVQSEKLVDILTMKPSSRPKARKANGATRKPRTPKPAETNSASPTA